MKKASKILHIVAGAFGAYNLFSILIMPLISVCYVLMGIVSILVPLATTDTMPPDQIVLGAVFIVLGILLFFAAIVRIVLLILFTLFAFLGIKNKKAINVLNIVMGVLVFGSSFLLGILSILAGVFGLVAAKQEKAEAIEEAPAEETKLVDEK